MSALKDDLYNREAIQELADVIHELHPPFRKQRFLKSVFAAGWEYLELKARMRRVTTSIHDTLELPYRPAIKILGQAARQGSGFHYISLSDYIEVYGQHDLETSLPALRATTVACTAEFAVRPFLIAHQSRLLKEMRTWATDADRRVRRLASEGCRPRLPWARALPALKKDPAPILPILELLKEDSDDAVRRSVANNLNDISKDHPEVFLTIARRWHGKHARTDALLKHAARTLLKKGHSEVLQLFGLDSTAATVKRLRLGRKEIPLGSDLTFNFELLVEEPARVRLEFAIYYLRKNGQYGRKVYHIAERDFDKRQSFARRRSMADCSTRTHHLGAHYIALIVNGREQQKRRFMLIASPRTRRQTANGQKGKFQR